MSMQQSFADRMALLRAGDRDEWTRLFEEYLHRLIGLARRHLFERLRAKVSPEDVVNSALKSFFARAGDGEQCDLQAEDGMWMKLVEFVLRKCDRLNKHFRAQKRDYRREVPGSTSSGEGDVDYPIPDDEPGPDEVAALADELEQLARILTPRQMAVLEMRLQGFTDLEISERLNISERTVYRDGEDVRARVRHLLSQK